MLYFIPAWYHNGTWGEQEQSWYSRRAVTEFDDTVKQVQLFHRSRVYPYQILLLGYHPNLRHFLHRQGVYRAPYWSCFDAIACVSSGRNRVISYRDLQWPEGTYFIYTSFVVDAMVDCKKYAQIDFGEDGNFIRVSINKGGTLWRINNYDDRGFLSSSIVHDNGKPIYQEYFQENGSLKLRHFFGDGHVDINPKEPDYLLIKDGQHTYQPFSKLRYASMSEVIKEVLDAFLAGTSDEDIFCWAVDDLHTPILKESLAGKKSVLSFFGNRVNLDENGAGKDLLPLCKYVVTDSADRTFQVVNYLGSFSIRQLDITPYDFREDYGISQQLTTQKIMVPVDNLPRQVFDKIVLILAEYLQENDKAEVCIFTRQSRYDIEQRTLSDIAKILEGNGFPVGWARRDDGQSAENPFLEEEDVPIRFYMSQCVEELAVSLCMKEQRLLVDLRNEPDVYLQVSALSMGLPQVVTHASQFVKDGQNGSVLEDVSALGEAVRYYLDTMANWNKAMIASFQIGSFYSTKVQIEKWEEVISSLG